MNPEMKMMNSDALTCPIAEAIGPNAPQFARDEWFTPRHRASQDWRYWAKRLLVCNPFFLCSAALLLFAINRLSVDTSFLPNETQNLLFNFSALQFYEVLGVVAAVLLASRKVWYDSSLLVVLENGLVLVPFMLLSQATLIGSGIAWALTLGGGAVAVCRFLVVRRFYPKFNLPDKVLLLGLIILLANVVLPRVFRPWIEKDVEDWQMPNLIIWYVALPLLVSGANLLPKPLRYGGNNPERHWLPLFIYALWVAGSAVHAWCLAHICNLPFGLALLGPVALMAAWTMFHRIGDCLVNPSASWKNAMLSLTFVAPILSFKEPYLCLLLCGVNMAGYLAVWFFASEQNSRFARELLLATAVMILAGLPQPWLTKFGVELNQERWMAACALIYCSFWCLRTRRPSAGFLGAVSVGFVVSMIWGRWSGHAAVQASFVYLLVQSMRWPETVSLGLPGTRFCAAGLWILDALAWTWEGDWGESLWVGSGGLIILVMWLMGWWWRGYRGIWLFPAAASVVLLCGPVGWFQRHSSEGMIALAGSFLLFGLGFLVAWTKHHWEKKGSLVEAGPED